jgi:protease PrsW
MSEALEVLVSLIPVLLFLLALFLLDNYKLVPLASVVRAIVYGVAVALACLAVAHWALTSLLVGAETYTRYIAPVVEETGKGVFLLYLIRRKRVGFMVDAGILGFAVGAGFATAENLYYLSTVHDTSPLLWLVRGFGTAVMHGGNTAVVGIAAKALSELRRGRSNLAFIPGLAVAIVLHSAFNHFVLPPVASTILLLLTFPLLIFLVFDRSETLLRDWLEIGFGSDVELLEMLRSGELKGTRVGDYLRSLKDRFPGEVLADMLCYLLLRVELSIQAKGILLLREVGIAPRIDPATRDKLRELHYLESSIGRTGRLALGPFLHTSARDLWQIYMLEKGSK